MKLPLRSASLFALGALSASAACTFHTPSTPGSDTGRLAFSYESGDCFLGCDIAGRPMMVGTTESINAASTGPLANVTASSDDPSVVAVLPGPVSLTCSTPGAVTSSTISCPPSSTASASFQVQAGASGLTKVHVFQGAVEVDAIDLEVDAPAAITPTCGQSSAITLAVGTQSAVDWSVTDAQGETMQASTGMTLAVVDPRVAELSTLFGSPSPTTGGSDSFLAETNLDAISAGTTQLTIASGGVTGNATVTVTSK
jgi:hypothetical protein